jgi:Ca2+-binding RTX toxin-like protein
MPITGNNNNNILLGDANDNLIFGLGGADLLEGFRGDDTLDGGIGRDVLVGGEDNDTLIGGDGKDTLTGGDGLDIFKFDKVAGAGDTITDFKRADDLIQIDLVQFFVIENEAVVRLPAGVLAAKNFSFGAANDPDDYFIYKPATGKLFFDRDGNTNSPGFNPVLVAQLAPGTVLTHNQIVMV